MKNIDIDIDIGILENIDINIDNDKGILQKGILQNIDIDEISYRLGFGISNTPTVPSEARQSFTETLPEAQRTQGIEFITQINFLTEINLTLS